LLLRRRQRTGGHGNHHGVVTRKNDVDPDNLDQADPEIGALKGIHASFSTCCCEKSARRVCGRFLLFTWCAERISAVF
jgi:hypothetical protein